MSGAHPLNKVPLKYLSSLNPTVQFNKLQESDEVTFLPMDRVKSGYFIPNTGKLREISSSHSVFGEGDLLIAKVTPCFENGNIAIAEGLVNAHGFGSSELFVLRPIKIETRFLFWCMQSLTFKQEAEASMTGAGGLKRVSSELMRQYRIDLPSREMQISISRFIDRKAARIDTLIAKKTRFIELLKEKRQAVITKAVTKGLDDSVEMKESGLKWLGSVPRHWSVMACKYGCSLIKDGTHLPPPRVEGGIPLLSVRNVQDGKFDFRPDDSTISESDYLELCRSFVPKANDVLLAIVGATIGKTAVVPENMGRFHLQRSLAVFRVKKRLNHLFLNLIFQSAGYQQLLWESIGFSAQPGVYLGALSGFRIPVPPLDEQLRIVEYALDKTQRTDTIIEKTERSIELLKEHRAALITAAVTGKIDVREAA